MWREDAPENHAWLGRAANVIERWDPLKGPVFSLLAMEFHGPMAHEALQAFEQIVVLLHQALNDLRIQTKILTLKRYLRQLQSQDDVILQSRGREIPMPVSTTILRLFQEINKTFPEFNLSFEGHGQAEALRSQLSIAIQEISDRVDTTDSKAVDPNEKAIRPTNPELVFVIHGRQLLEEFHTFLRALGLKPLEWSGARRRTGKPNPYTWEIVDRALSEAGAIVALLTPDDEARLRQHLWSAHENALEKAYLSQPRQNVLFEAGVAYGRAPQRTVLVRVGSHRPMSDLAGHHILQLDDSPQSRQAVADALRAAGCPVEVSGTDWFRAGKFMLSEQPAGPRKESEGIGAEADPLEPRGPILTFDHITDLRLDNSGIVLGSTGVYVKNDQSRVRTTAHNLKAVIKFTHNVLEGQAFTVSGLWLDQKAFRDVLRPQGTTYESVTSIGMLEAKYLLVLFRDNTSHFYPAKKWPPQFFENDQLDYGEWTVNIEVVGDNASSASSYILQLRPDGSVACTKRS